MRKGNMRTYPNQKTAEQVLGDILWRQGEIESLQRTINELCEYSKTLPDYEEYKEAIESYKEFNI